MYEHLYINGKYKSAIDLRMEESNTVGNLKVLKSKLQTLYCFDQESTNILNFKKYLSTYYDITKTSVVPFFDGIMVKYDGLRIVDELPFLPEIVSNYNLTSNIKFKVKPIAEEYETITKGDFDKIKRALRKM